MIQSSRWRSAHKMRITIKRRRRRTGSRTGQTDKAAGKMSPPSHFDFFEARDKFTVNY